MNKLSNFYCMPLIGVLDLSKVTKVDELQTRNYNDTHSTLLFRIHIIGKGFPLVIRKQFKNTALGQKRCVNAMSKIRKSLIDALDIYNQSLKQDESKGKGKLHSGSGVTGAGI